MNRFLAAGIAILVAALIVVALVSVKNVYADDVPEIWIDSCHPKPGPMLPHLLKA